MSDEVPPEGFSQLPRGLGFADSLQPCFLHIEDGRVSFGLFVQAAHSNSLGICHGGVLMTLADMAAATGVNVARGQRSGSPTVNLAVDFIAGARLGEWIHADVEQVSVKRRFGFSNGAIYNASGIVARFNGTFYLPDHDGMRKEGAPTDGLWRVLDES